MANVLNEEKKQQVLALGRLGWSLRRIQQATRIRRETASAHLKAAGIAVRPPSGWGRCEPKPANEVITDSGAAKPAIPVIPDPLDPNANPCTTLLSLFLSLITVTFSIPTGDFTQNSDCECNRDV